METNVSTLLREFPKVRRAALSGQSVIVHTREGDLLLTKAPPSNRGVLGSLAGEMLHSDDTIDTPTTQMGDWEN